MTIRLGFLPRAGPERAAHGNSSRWTCFGKLERLPDGGWQSVPRHKPKAQPLKEAGCRLGQQVSVLRLGRRDAKSVLDELSADPGPM
jgi:hypothetical protein